MSLVKVSWTETKSYEAEIEVPNFDLDNGTPDDLLNAIYDLSEDALNDAHLDGDDVEISGHSIVR